jgi:hypothetical protein
MRMWPPLPSPETRTSGSPPLPARRSPDVCFQGTAHLEDCRPTASGRGDAKVPFDDFVRIEQRPTDPSHHGGGDESLNGEHADLPARPRRREQRKHWQTPWTTLKQADELPVRRARHRASEGISLHETCQVTTSAHHDLRVEWEALQKLVPNRCGTCRRAHHERPRRPDADDIECRKTTNEDTWPERLVTADIHATKEDDRRQRVSPPSRTAEAAKLTGRGPTETPVE